MYLVYLLIAIVVLLMMVLVHEFGHYIVGRMLNFKIEEFSVGFGKALFSRKNKRGEQISLRIFPLGGYCAFAGEDETSEKNKDAFTNQKPWKRILVFLAGVTFNFAFAVIFSFILLCTIGYDIPQAKSIISKDNIVNEYQIKNLVDGAVVEGPELNLDETVQPGDIVISIEGNKIDFAYGVSYQQYLEQKAEYFDKNKESFNEIAIVDAVVRRGDKYENVKLSFSRVEVHNLDKKNNITSGTHYVYCCNMNAQAYVHTVKEAFERAVPFTMGLGWTVLKSFWLLITFQIPISEIGGPVTTIATIANFTKMNALNLLILIPLISANLAVFNLLPIPALDGAHIVFTTIEAIRKKPIKREIENMIHAVGLFILFGAVILIDILHFLL